MEIKCLLIYAEVNGSEGGEETRQWAPARVRRSLKTIRC